jgi:RHS repeat-associated protein
MTVNRTNGNVDQRQRFLPFGGTHTTAGSDLAGRGYTGHLHNDGVGLIYMNARYYVPSLGRFASADTLVPDPTNPQSFNRYSYVHNNPLIYTDPTGHWIESAWDVFNVGLGLYSLQDNLSQGNYGWAAVDVAGLVVDATALAVPIVPGGVSSALKAARGVDAAVDAIQTVQVVNQSSNVFSVVKQYADEVVENVQDVVYRGLNPDNPNQLHQLEEFAESGVIRPNGGDATLDAHWLGDTDSNFTSWSRSESIASRFAGDHGTIVALDLNSLSNNHWARGEYDHFDFELEVTIEGLIRGAWTHDGPR